MLAAKARYSSFLVCSCQGRSKQGKMRHRVETSPLVAGETFGANGRSRGRRRAKVGREELHLAVHEVVAKGTFDAIQQQELPTQINVE